MDRKIILSCCLIFLCGILMYYPSLGFGFSQDDFIHLSASRVNSISGVLNFFNPFATFPAIYFYRPLPTQLWFFLNDHIFGINPFVYHFESLLVHCFNGLLLFIIVNRIWKNFTAALLSSLLYVTAAIHFLSLFYISSFQEVARTFFVFLSILFWLKYIKIRGALYYLISLIGFFIALSCKETALVTPPLLVILSLYSQGRVSMKKVVSLIKVLWAFWAVIIIYLLVRIAGFIRLFGQGSYHSSFSLLNLIQNLKWYVLWSIGLPEALSYYPSLKPNWLIQFAKDLPLGGWVMVSSFMVICLIVILTILLVLKKGIRWRPIMFLLSWFLISLLPLLPLAKHRYPQYLDLFYLVALPLAIISFNSLKGRFSAVFKLILLFAFILLQFTSVKLSQLDHWTTHRSEVANYYYTFLRKHDSVSEGETVRFVGSKTAQNQLSYALAGDFAVKDWYPGKSVKVVYSDKFSPSDINVVITFY